MTLATYAIRHNAVMMVLSLMIIVGGIFAYGKIGRLEDPAFTIKTALIFTQYPGATAEEVEQEVSEPLETAIQQLKQLDEVTSISRAGQSIVLAEMQDRYDKDTLPQVWDELRRKVSSVSGSLPPGCLPPSINDDFGDVFGLFFAITGDGYSPSDLEAIAEDLRRELLLCKDVGRIDFWGIQQEVIYVEMNRAKLTQLGMSPLSIFDTLKGQNGVSNAGIIHVGTEHVKLRVTGAFDSVDDIGEQLIRGGADGRMLRLKDVASIEKGYIKPARELLKRNDKPAVALGISTVMGGNVVVMGDSVNAKLEVLRSRLPVGVTIHTIAHQANTVRTSVNGFVLNLVEAIIIVVLLLVVFMGWREGIIIGVILLVTILATFIGMYAFEINLQRISLGALIIALGMLVDNAIVVAEGIVIKSHKGTPRELAARETVRETQWPLLGATIIAILAFAAISLSKDVTGEFLGSLFQVIAMSLGLSWIFAVTITPYLCVAWLPDETNEEGEPYEHIIYKMYKRILVACVKHRWVTISAVVGMLVCAIIAFGSIKKNFFPDAPRSQFTVDVWLPEGTHIDDTASALDKLAKEIKKLDGITDITAFAGRGALRFILTYNQEMPNASYGQLLVDVKDFRKIKKLIPQVLEITKRITPNAVTSADMFKLGPGGKAVEVRLQGPDTDVLRMLASKVKTILAKNPNARTVKTNWGELAKTQQINMALTRAREIGVSRSEIAQTLAMNFSGVNVGLYRENENLLPIILRPPLEQRQGIDNLNNVQVWSNVAQQTVPLAQVVDGTTVIWENPVIHRLNRMRTITVSCSQITGTANGLFKTIKSDIEAIDFPAGYSMQWGGEFESAKEANGKLLSKVPLAFAMMFFISVMLFNTLRHPIIIFLGLPLALIGVSAGLLIADQPFGFMATLGFLSLSGMLIKNEIVLLDQINIELAAGLKPYDAVINSSVSRMRPVSMAAITTILGMIPLLWDAFFVAMAVTIMAGLTFATVLTLIVIPVLYCVFFKVKAEK